MKDLTEILIEMGQKMDGVSSICVVDSSSGLILAHYEDAALFNPQNIAAEMASFYLDLARMVEKTKTGSCSRCLIETDLAYFAITPINDKVFLAIASDVEKGNVGQARYVSSHYADIIKQYVP